MHCLGLIGKNGSGKSTVCQYLDSKGYTSISLSDCIRDVATERGLSHDRDQLTNLANQLKQEYGTDYFAQYVYQKALDRKLERVVFDSIRHKDECRFLMSKSVRLLAVECPIKLRYERIIKRQRESDYIDFDTFKQQDERESTGTSFGQTINECVSVCEFKIMNLGDLTQLEKSVDEVLSYVS